MKEEQQDLDSWQIAESLIYWLFWIVIRIHRLKALPCTAEVAGSSPVVPAIDSKRLTWNLRNSVGVQKGHKNVPLLHPNSAIPHGI